MLVRLEQAQEQYDIKSLDEMITADFERSVFLSDSEVLIENREKYLEGRNDWPGAPSAVIDIVYEIQSVTKSEDAGLVDVVALSTWRSQLFAPRFLETLRFRLDNGQWLLSQQILVPVHPAKAKGHSVEILVVKKTMNPAEVTAEFARRLSTSGPDAVFEDLEPLKKGENTSDVQLIAIFKEPPRQALQ